MAPSNERLIAWQKPASLSNLESLRDILPYGKGSFRAVHGGLDIAKPDAGITVIANAAVIVSFDMEPAT